MIRRKCDLCHLAIMMTQLLKEFFPDFDETEAIRKHGWTCILPSGLV